MKVTEAEPVFRPVTIVLETQDEYDMLRAVLSAVFTNAVHIRPQVIAAARTLDLAIKHELGE